MNNEEHYTEIDLTALLKALWRHIWLIAASVIVIGAMAFSYARFFVTPMYTASALMYVNNNSLSVGSTKVSLSAGDLSAAKSLVNTYVVILNARTTMNEVIREAGVDYTYTDMQGMISAGAVNSTEVVQIDVTMPDPQEAALVANSVTKVLPERIAAIMDGRPRGGHRRSPVHTLLPQLHQLYGAGYAAGTGAELRLCGAAPAAGRSGAGRGLPDPELSRHPRSGGDTRPEPDEA